MNKLLNRKELLELIDTGELIIRPLLDKENQIGNMSVDFRLGGDFLVSQISRDSYIDVTSPEIHNSLHRSFKETRRLVGEPYIYYPNQLALCSSLEYLKIPNYVYMILSMRSSYNRLGLSFYNVIKPGYCGCLSFELVNRNHIPIKVTVGAKIIHAKFFRIPEDTSIDSENYRKSKYFCQVRPIYSKASLDPELKILNNFFSQRKTKS